MTNDRLSHGRKKKRVESRQKQRHLRNMRENKPRRKEGRRNEST